MEHLILSIIFSHLASGGWPEKELPFGKTLTNLLGYYKQLAHNDKMERERQKMSKRRTNLYLMVCVLVVNNRELLKLWYFHSNSF